MTETKRLINREISWLSFNERVLQEAEDPSVPLVERMRFLGIFSNNQDEFFRVRVATVKRLVSLEKKSRSFVGIPEEVEGEIQEVVIRLQKKFERVYQSILDELADHDIHKLSETQLDKKQKEHVEEIFREKVLSNVIPIILNRVPEFPHLRDKGIYLVVGMNRPEKKSTYALIEIPPTLPRFVVLPERDKKKYWIMMDDVIRANLDVIFSVFDYKSISAYTFKFTRDAEMDLDHDVSKSFLEKMKKSLRQRKKGEPVRFVYDSEMPEEMLKFLMRKLKIDKQDNMIPGARYHNFKDFMKFPNMGPKSFLHPPAKPLNHPDLAERGSVFEAMRKGDIMLHYPYHTYDHYLDLLREAAIDSKVKSIHITLYRVASESKVINALVNAAKNGINVTVIVELQARFDEEANIYWSNFLQEAGVNVVHGFRDMKVHSKLCVITRKEQGALRYYASIGTGNFNESTAKIYSDLMMLTCHPELTKEARRIFEFFDQTLRSNNYFKHLIVSPISTRVRLTRLINTEIRNAKAGRQASITIKTNSLVDPEMIRKLYDAHKAGVKITLIVRGICSLIPGVKGLSENIEAISIIDKYLEHSRIFVFGNHGDPLYFISSADWMGRNLDHRIEVTCPVYDKKIQKELQDLIDIQLSDNVKARLLEGSLKNKYRKAGKDTKIRSQVALYDYYKKALNSRPKHGKE